MNQLIEWVMEYHFTEEQAKKIVEEAEKVASATDTRVTSVISDIISVTRFTMFPVGIPIHLLNLE